MLWRRQRTRRLDWDPAVSPRGGAKTGPAEVPATPCFLSLPLLFPQSPRSMLFSKRLQEWDPHSARLQVLSLPQDPLEPPNLPLPPSQVWFPQWPRAQASHPLHNLGLQAW